MPVVASACCVTLGLSLPCPAWKRKSAFRAHDSPSGEIGHFGRGTCSHPQAVERLVLSSSPSRLPNASLPEAGVGSSGGSPLAASGMGCYGEASRPARQPHRRGGLSPATHLVQLSVFLSQPEHSAHSIINLMKRAKHSISLLLTLAGHRPRGPAQTAGVSAGR